MVSDEFDIKGMMIGGTTFDFTKRTYIMGVLNVTPDSFSDGGKYLNVNDAVAHAMRMIKEGADIIDVGGESTRPKGMYGEGAKKVTAEEEIKRVVPVIKKIRSSSDVAISIDTYKSVVAEEALSAGASIVNDISGLKFDPQIASVAARHQAALVVMHIQGTPETMQLNPRYADVVAEVKEELKRSVEQAKIAGVEQVIIDPGIGFGKNLHHNLLLLKHLNEFHELGCPVLVGTSRKGFLGTLLNLPVEQRMEGTAASVAVAIINGANIVRVHDVKEMKRVATVVDAIKQA
jgi:dihydropteroate synthase